MEIFHFQFQIDVLLNLLIAIILGGAIGFEREYAAKPAGIRTHMLVCAASALFVHLGKVVGPLLSDYESQINMDPTRVLHSIILGISFIGAGVIFQNTKSGKVHNLTTAASLWFITGVGISVGMKLYYLAAGATVLGLIVNYLVGRFEDKKMDEYTESRPDDSRDSSEDKETQS